MSDDIHGLTQALIRDIEIKDRRFRMAQAVFMIVVAAALFVGGFWIYQLQVENKQLLAAQQKTLQAQGKATQQLNKHIDCIAQFFSSPNRSNETLQNDDNCDITVSAQNEVPTDTIVQTTIRSPVATITPSVIKPSAVTVATTPMNTPAPVTAPTQPSTGSEQPTQPASMLQPATLLGVPVCLLGVCVTTP